MTWSTNISEQKLFCSEEWAEIPPSCYKCLDSVIAAQGGRSRHWTKVHTLTYMCKCISTFPYSKTMTQQQWEIIKSKQIPILAIFPNAKLLRFSSLQKWVLCTRKDWTPQIGILGTSGWIHLTQTFQKVPKRVCVYRLHARVSELWGWHEEAEDIYFIKWMAPKGTRTGTKYVTLSFSS